jgi:hypothetical protein
VIQRKGPLLRGGPLEGFGPEYIGSHWGQVKSAIKLKKNRQLYHSLLSVSVLLFVMTKPIK